MTIKSLQALAFGVAALLVVASTASAEVQLSIQNGRVSIVAKDATVRQILTEWARVGQTKIVNVERIPGAPMTIQLDNVAESQALDILLRAMSGYIAAPRPVEGLAANLSQFDRIIVMPTLASARPPAGPPTAPVYQPTPQFAQPQQVTDDDQEPEQPAQAVPMPTGRGPVFNTFPQQPQTVVSPQNGQPMNVAPQQPVPVTPQPGAYPAMPAGGVAVPGMIVQPPQQPGQQQPGVPVRRPGGPDGQ